ncbi:FAD-dependent oxidoreductase [Nocardia brasiliensis]|uniref:FAD-dependent oxidoreductase n=1 Tax=Nocardia brasiliensis TaxID=37326 RepID=UPI00366A835F
MLTPADITGQYADASQDELRVLIVGAGIAGVTAAQLLRRAGQHPVLIERAHDDSHVGYMLALMPMIDPVLDELAVRPSYRARSVPLRRFGLRAHSGRVLRADSVERILARFGDYRGIARGELIDALTPDGCPVGFGTTVSALTETPGAIIATLSRAGTHTELEFDLVIIADGLNSTTRQLVLAGREVDKFDTGWGGWVVWTPTDSAPDLGEELWGAGFFLGTYPVLDRLGVFLGGPRADTDAGPGPFVNQVRRRLTTIDPRVERALQAVLDDPGRYYWPLTDCRAPAWTTGRSVLLGDAAAGFLPTAGLGAGMALESAWVLSRMLRRARPDTIEPLLRAYQYTQRPRVEAAQNTSRRLARIMFRRSRTIALLRDVALRATSVEVALKPIQRLIDDRPDPEAAAARFAQAGRQR